MTLLPKEDDLVSVGQSPAHHWGDLRVIWLFLGLTVAFWRHGLVPGLPTEILLLAVWIGVAAFVRPTLSTPKLAWFALTYAALVLYVVVLSMSLGQPFEQRSVRFVLLFLVAIAIVQGRMHWRSVVAGGALSLAFINAPGYYLGVAPDEYPPYLTGWLGDKNVAGLYYAVFALLGMGLFQKAWQRTVYFTLFLVFVWLTGSRTALAAAALGMAWWLLRNRLGIVTRLLGVAVSVWLLNLIKERFSQVGVFANREGTDWFREVVQSATQTVVEHTAWYGRGLNTAHVVLPNGHMMYFHDSYAALYVEGGVFMLTAILVIFVVMGLGIFDTRRASGALRGAEGAVVVLLVCARELGEVYFTSVAFLALAVALHERWALVDEPCTEVVPLDRVDGHEVRSG